MSVPRDGRHRCFPGNIDHAESAERQNFAYYGLGYSTGTSRQLFGASIDNDLRQDLGC